MPVTTCHHNENIEKSSDSGVEMGECRVCHQVRRYDYRNSPRPVIEVIKLGRINKVIVEPAARDTLNITSKEMAALEAAIKEPTPETKQPARESQRPVTESVEPPDNIGIKGGVELKEGIFHVEPQTSRQWYQEHKREMIDDLITWERTMDHKELVGAFVNKWKHKPQILSHLKSDKLYAKLAAKRKDELVTPIKTDAKEVKTATSISFPPFDPSMPESVQCKWLESYVEIRRMENSRGH